MICSHQSCRPPCVPILPQSDFSRFFLPLATCGDGFTIAARIGNEDSRLFAGIRHLR